MKKIFVTRKLLRSNEDKLSNLYEVKGAEIIIVSSGVNVSIVLTAMLGNKR